MGDFSSITAICVDTLNHELALRACREMSKHGFAEVVLVTDAAVAPWLRRTPVPGLRIDTIAPLRGRGAYSNYVLRQLSGHVHTPHALIFQWDGYVIDPDLWRADFLAYDYVGAPFPWELPQELKAKRVGNGGFSLRSAKLMRAVEDMVVEDTDQCEDLVICALLADRLEREHGLRFAPADLARHFSVDQMSLPGYRLREPGLVAERTFGFHGFLNFHLVFSDDELLEIVDHRLGAFRDKLLASFPTGALMVNLTAAGRSEAVAALVGRIAPLLGMDPATASPKEIVARCQFNHVS
jgi:hypothetical protein